MNLKIFYADLKVTKTVNVQNNTTLIYKISVNNKGPYTAKMVVVSDVLPANVTFIPNGSSNLWIGPINGKLTANLGNMRPGKTMLLVIEAAGSEFTQYVNNVEVSSQTPDPNKSNNTASVSAITAGLS